MNVHGPNGQSIDDFLNARLPAYLDLLHQMVDINSFTANAEGVNRLADLTAQTFEQIGFRSESIQSVNPAFGRHLLFYGPGWSADDRRPAILMISHLDTVFPPQEEQANEFYWIVEGDKAFGPGTVDIKGGTVLCFAVLETLKTCRPHIFNAIRWLIALDASEETLSEDFGQLCLQRLPDNALACLVFEGGTPNPNGLQLVTARKGRAEFRVTVEGRGAHAGNYHKQGANAIVQMAHTIQQISTFTDYAKSITFNVGVVQGGSVVNRVPHYAESLLEMRAFDPDIFETGKQKVLAINGSSQIASQDGYPCRVRVELLSQSPPWPRNPGTDRLFEVWSEAAQELGIQTVPEQRGGLSDGNHLWQTLPTLDGLGPIGNNAHCSERSLDGSKEPEYVLLSSLKPKIQLNVAAITRLITSLPPLDSK